MFRFATLLAVTIAAGAQPAAGAVFQLANGGQVVGKLLNPDQTPRENYLIEMSGGRIAIASEQVTKVVEASEAERWYHQWLPKMPPTVEGHWTMAEECRQRGLKKQREFHLEQIIKLAPNHKEARYGLGYSNVDGEWVQTDQWMRSQGYIRYRGAWRIPQDVAIEQARDKSEKEVKLWKNKIKMWRSWIARPRGKEQDAMDAIRRIKDWRASGALADIVRDEEAPYNLRQLCIKVLGNLQTGNGVSAFIDRAVSDPDPRIRDACVDELVKFGAVRASAAFAAELKSKDNKKVNRAASALGQLDAADATLQLIDSLVTEHKFIITTGSPGQMNLGFGSGPSGGGNSFSAGSSPKVVTKNLRNASVHAALVLINPGFNFGYDQEAWKDWYIKQHTPITANLRRDD